MSILAKFSGRTTMFPTIQEGQHTIKIQKIEEATSGDYAFLKLTALVNQDNIEIPTSINIFETGAPIFLNSIQRQMGKASDIVEVQEIENFLLSNQVSAWFKILPNPTGGQAYRNWYFYDPDSEPSEQPSPQNASTKTTTTARRKTKKEDLPF